MLPHNTKPFVVDPDATVDELANLASCMAGAVTQIVSDSTEMMKSASATTVLFGALYLAESVEKLLEAIQARALRDKRDAQGRS